MSGDSTKLHHRFTSARPGGQRLPAESVPPPKIRTNSRPSRRADLFITDPSLLAKKPARIERRGADLRRLARPAAAVDIREPRFGEYTPPTAVSAAVAFDIVSDEHLGEPPTNRALFELPARGLARPVACAHPRGHGPVPQPAGARLRRCGPPPPVSDPRLASRRLAGLCSLDGGAFSAPPSPLVPHPSAALHVPFPALPRRTWWLR